MKYIIAVIACDGIYSKMKDIWIHNMLLYGIDDMELYFIYGKHEQNKEVEKLIGNIYNFYGKNEEKFENILLKTLDFMEYIDRKYDKYMMIRSNMSTMFNLPLLRHYMNVVSIYNLYVGGTFTGIKFKDESQMMIISGTNMCLSKEIVRWCITGREIMKEYNMIDDTALSVYIFELSKDTKIVMCNMPRIDILDKLELQHCNSALGVCCFRFKSSDREEDIKRMYKFLNSNFDINLVEEFTSLGIVSVNELDMYTKPFIYEGNWLNKFVIDIVL